MTAAHGCSTALRVRQNLRGPPPIRYSLRGPLCAGEAFCLKVLCARHCASLPFLSEPAGLGARCYRSTSSRSSWLLPPHLSLDYCELAKKTPDLDVSDDAGCEQRVRAFACETARELVCQMIDFSFTRSTGACTDPRNRRSAITLLLEGRTPMARPFVLE